MATKLNILKPVLGVTGMSDNDLLARLNAVHDKMLNNPAYPTPPVDMPSFQTAIDACTAAVADALEGGKAATVLRDKCRNAAIVMFRLLGHYVESACKGDVPTFVSSGFVLSSTGQRTPPQPVAVPLIISLDQGSTGQLLVTMQPVSKARMYEIRYAPEPAAGATAVWTETTVTGTKPAVPINGLNKGVNYIFQVRALGKLGPSDWSSLVERICI
ncbi:MAG TPA: fibronectin type III domain-containing protein [Terriglobia bacterium]|jgi:hypothetical protein